MKVILYARVSSESQRDNNISLSDQLKAMRAHAHKNEWFIYSEVQESYSGREYDRPYLDTIRELAKQHGEFDALVVYRMDRFARDELVFQLLERYFKRCGIRLFSVEDGEFTVGVINRYLSAIKRAQAAEEVETFRKRSMEARHGYAQSGIPPGQGLPVYGYDKQGKKRETRYIINKKEADIVRLIFDMFVREGLSVIEIAVQLAEMHIPCPSAAKGANRSITGKWHNTLVRRMLGNTAYIGSLVIYTTKVDNNGKQVLADKSEHITVPIPPIVDKKTFQQAQYMLTNRSKQGKHSQKRDYILSSMLVCSCGKLMSGGSVGSKRKTMQGLRYNYFYRCSARNRILERLACGNKALPAFDIEYTVWDFVQRLIRDPKTTLALYQKDQGAKQAITSNVQERLAAIDDLIIENTGELRRLQRMYQKGGCDDDYFDAERKRLDVERKALDTQRVKAQALLDHNKNAIAQLAELEEIGEEIRSSLFGVTEKRKRRIYQRLRLRVTSEASQSQERHVVIEVLGYSERVRVKNSSAPRLDFYTSAELPLMFRVPLLHTQQD